MKDTYDLFNAEDIAKIKKWAEKFKPLFCGKESLPGCANLKDLILCCLKLNKPASLYSDKSVENQLGVYGIPTFAWIEENFTCSGLRNSSGVTPEEKKEAKEAREKGKDFDLSAYRKKKYGSSEEIRRFATALCDSFANAEKRRVEAVQARKRSEEERKRHMIKAKIEKIKIEKQIKDKHKEIQGTIDSSNFIAAPGKLEEEIKKILSKSTYFKDQVTKWPKEYSKKYKFKISK